MHHHRGPIIITTKHARATPLPIINNHNQCITTGNTSILLQVRPISITTTNASTPVTTAQVTPSEVKAKHGHIINYQRKIGGNTMEKEIFF